jgi:hypothetical protein
MFKGTHYSGFSPGYRIFSMYLPVTGFLVMTIKRAQVVNPDSYREPISWAESV